MRGVDAVELAPQPATPQASLVSGKSNPEHVRKLIERHKPVKPKKMPKAKDVTLPQRIRTVKPQPQPRGEPKSVWALIQRYGGRKH